jgi:aspartyl-tRNA(Asn)/glutamyl-tRNA(Gln) amidotransferase subunit B
VGTAAGTDRGIHVVYGTDDFMPLNLKFQRAGRSSVTEAASGGGAFRNWNAGGLKRTGNSLVPSARTLPVEKLTALLEEAISRTFIAKVYPGMRGETLIALMDAGIRYFVLEIYDTGTANLRETPFSLRKALTQGRERGVHFFCTSQQEGVVDFSEYVTAHQLWREGAVPMGTLTTESAWTRLIAAQVESAAGEYDGEDGDDTVLRLMEVGE